MEYFICTTCGTQYELSETPLEQCLICNDEQQYVNWQEQSWTTLLKLDKSHSNLFKKLPNQIYEICISPAFGIRQHAILICIEHGNVLWDCVSLLDDVTIDIITQLRGIPTIAINHLHSYAFMEHNKEKHIIRRTTSF